MTERHYSEQQVQSVRRIMSETCFYRILGVSKDGTDSDFKKAYRKVLVLLSRSLLKFILIRIGLLTRKMLSKRYVSGL